MRSILLDCDSLRSGIWKYPDLGQPVPDHYRSTHFKNIGVESLPLKKAFKKPVRIDRKVVREGYLMGRHRAIQVLLAFSLLYVSIGVAGCGLWEIGRASCRERV